MGVCCALSVTRRSPWLRCRISGSISAACARIASIMSCADNLPALKRGKYSAMKGNEAVGLVAPQAVHRHLGLGREF